MLVAAFVSVQAAGGAPKVALVAVHRAAQLHRVHRVSMRRFGTQFQGFFFVFGR